MRTGNATKLITCIIPAGMAADIVRRLRTEHGIVEANVHTARGMGKLTPVAHRGLGAQTEKEVLDVVVAAARADELFAWLFHEARVDRPHGGILFMSALARSTPFVLPVVPEES